MDFSLTEEHQMLRDSVRDFAEREVGPIISEYDKRQKSVYPQVLPKMGELGILGVCIPEKLEGSGLDYLALAIVSEELERMDTSLRVIMSVHTALSSLSLYQWGTTEQQEKYLIPQAKGKKIGAFGLTEPNTGSDVANLKTKAVVEGDEFVLNGAKQWISLVEVADNFLIFAKLGKEKGYRGIAAFIVEKEFSGVSTTSFHDKLGIRTGDTGEIILQDVRVPKENLLGQEGEGFKIAMSALDNGRFTVAAGACGLIKASIDASVEYCHERKAFGQEIGKFELIQEHLAYMQAGYDQSQLLVYKCAWMKNQGLKNTRETAIAKWQATNHASDAANRAIQIHGANGYSGDFPVERYWRNARANTILEGTNEIQKLIQGSFLLGYRKPTSLRCTLPAYEHES
ncbi:butyryl-CoA dehydrogenase [Candidatus Heimdallarchaeota archaeon B3_Heim]|nr:MAG: butyryl-CoA dehydrogenase [Candidatus Heimdallarchaeota archaeon B3_Heim]